MRVLPLENEDVNECWLSDRDRFSYEALNSRRAADRADDHAGRRVEDGRLDRRARLRRARPDADRASSTARRASARSASPHQHASRSCTCSPSWCAASAARTSTSALRQADFRAAPAARPLARHARSPRCRQLRARARRRLVPAQGPSAVRAAPAPGGAQGRARCMSLHALRRRLADADGRRASPRRRAPGPQALADDRRRGRRDASGVAAPVAGATRATRRKAIAAALPSGERKAVLLGNAAAQHPQAAPLLERLAQLDRRADRRDASAGSVDGGNARRRAARRRRAVGERRLDARPRCSAPTRR